MESQALIYEYLHNYQGKDLSACPDIPLDFIEEHIDRFWNWSMLSINPHITMEFVDKHINKYWNWGRYGLSWNRTITLEFIERHINRHWDWGTYGLSSNPHITPAFVRKYRDKPWDLKMLNEDIFSKLKTLWLFEMFDPNIRHVIKKFF